MNCVRPPTRILRKTQSLNKTKYSMEKKHQKKYHKIK